MRWAPRARWLRRPASRGPGGNGRGFDSLASSSTLGLAELSCVANPEYHAFPTMSTGEDDADIDSDQRPDKAGANGRRLGPTGWTGTYMMS